MNGANPSVLLSTEELLAVLDMLQANFIPGLDGDIAQALSSQERQLMLTTARHSLLARELLRENENGAALHRRIMAAVGACVYSQGAILAFHWPPKSGQPSRFFGHFQGNEVVAHTRPKEILHRFVIFDERAALVDALLEAFEHEPTPPAPPWKLAVARDLLATARSDAEAGRLDQAMRVLSAHGQSDPAVRVLVQTFAASPRVTILQLLKQGNEKSALSQTMTLVQDKRYLWMMLPDDEARQQLVVQTSSVAEVANYLTHWFD
ncbi:MAG: hypothetical protein KDD73_16385 [Anaerolineales bacterium]|nr:hypothetical protein [Anaerolineales bacterium]MCB9172838.1 hypothetical protein [Ardenticatenales bacterium]